MGLFSSSKSSSSTNIYDERIGADGGSIAARDSVVTVTDHNAVATAGAVAVETAKQAAASAQKALAATSDVAKTAIQESLLFGGDTVKEGLRFGETTQERAFDFGTDAIGFGERALIEVLDLVELQQSANQKSQSATNELSLSALQKVSESTRSEGERTLQQLIMWAGIVLLGLFLSPMLRKAVRI